ncbi:flagella basal body P-ring formation protein FlgA [Tistlia consotensis]|uniref:Flagella basal body P-ring formation protein FlgA n=1 Tax=Tistlia consotensis USBA 355 TaxID=560819 RepID=A0A1Y6CIY9_9PROT|nr:flagellar basal body P-ring formation chaperone FlgA [Tistlia consotensis]SMF67949.1 flagella basal body P-ring formation protein FlgA [Tistlia consotensis USBA 355]SNR99300.1 flagella basal body P-ring formation protein FlgA [Tistlia consotensis]
MLRRTRPLIIALALGGSLALPAAAGQTAARPETARDGAAQQTAALPDQLGSIDLKRPAIVSADVVTLGDLFTGLSAEQAGTPIARSPKLGESVPVDAAWLGLLAQHYKVAWQPRSHLDGTVVEHQAIVIGVPEVQDAVTKLLDDESNGEKLEVTVDNPSLSIALPLDSDGRFGLEGLRRDDRSGRFTVTLVYPETGQPTIRMPISGRAVQLVEVPVLLRRVADNEIISSGDVGWETRRADRLGSNLLTDPKDIIGLSPKRSLRAGEPVRAGDLRPPVLVERNSLVTMRLKAANMVLTAQGRALDDGGQGSVVRVVNLKSNTIVQATVAEAGVVDVGGTAQAALN